MLWLRLEIDGLGCRELHARCEFVTLDTRVEARIIGACSGVHAIQTHEQFVGIAFARIAHKSPDFVRIKICHRTRLSWIDHRSAVFVWKKRAVPILDAVRRHAAVIGHDDKRREILIHRTEPVTHPTASPRKSGQLKAR